MKLRYILCLIVALLCLAGAYAGGLRGPNAVRSLSDESTMTLDNADMDLDDLSLDALDQMLDELEQEDMDLAEFDDDDDSNARRLGMTREEAVAAKKAAIAAKLERVAAHRAKAAAALEKKKALHAKRAQEKAAAVAAKKEAIAKRNAQRAEAAARKRAAAEKKKQKRAAMIAAKAAKAQAKRDAAARKKAEAAKKHAHKHAPPAPPAPAPAAWAIADQAKLDAMPEACRAIATQHQTTPEGETAPLAWMTNANGGRNRFNTYKQRLAQSCCDVSATEETTLTWAEFYEQQGDCAAYAPVTIPCGTKVLIDGSELDGEPIELAGLYVEGELEFVDSGAPVELRTEFIFNCGELRAGDSESTYDSDLTITLTGFTTVYYKGSQFGRAGFVTYGGETFLKSSSCDKDTWTRLATGAKIGATELRLQLDDLELDTAWRAGDKLLVTSTGGTGTAGDQSELVEIVEVGGEDGRTVTIATPLKFGHAGCEEDGDDEVVPGISCTMAAEVAPLTRNIHIRGEEACKETQLCGHTIFAHTDHGTVCGVEHSNLGQRTTKGRYPLHLHMAGDAPDLVVRSNAIHDTFNRGMVIHSMRHVTFHDNTIYNTLGHNFLFEDGAEEHNKITHNLGVLAKGIQWGCKSSHDMSFLCGSRSDDAANAFWINNMNNEFRDNVGVTMGMAFRFEMRHVMGDTRLWFHPEAMKVGHNGKIKHSVRMGKFVGNVAHSSGIGFFSYPMQNPKNQKTAGYENTVVYNCKKGIHVKNTSRGGAMNIVGATLIYNWNHVTAHIPASRIMIRQSHMINCEGCGKTLPVNMRKTKFIGAVEGSIYLDDYSYDYARCRGGFTNPRAQYPRGRLNFLDQTGCDAAPARRFEAVPEVF